MTREPAGKTQSVTGRTTAWFQQYLLETNAALMKSQHNNESCWPVWGDNHAALFTSVTTDQVIANVNAGVEAGTVREEWAQWHGFLGQENGKPGFGHTSLYITEPSGWQLEINSVWKKPPQDMDVDYGDFSSSPRKLLGYCLTHC